MRDPGERLWGEANIDYSATSPRVDVLITEAVLPDIEIRDPDTPAIVREVYPLTHHAVEIV